MKICTAGFKIGLNFLVGILCGVGLIYAGKYISVRFNISFHIVRIIFYAIFGILMGCWIKRDIQKQQEEIDKFEHKL